MSKGASLKDASQINIANFLLDTTTVSDYLRRNKNIVRIIHGLKPSELAVSVITQYEIHYGMLKKPSLIPKYERQLEEFYRKISVLDFHSHIAIEAAQIKDELRQAGTLIEVPDIIIGATARFHELKVVTSNIKDFQRIRDLSIVDWKNS